jgi:hypothetical protein
MNEKINFLFFCMIFVANFSLAQKNVEKVLLSKGFYSNKPVVTKPSKTNTGLAFYNKKPVSPVKIAIANNPFVSFDPVSYFLISPSHYTQNFGFFCKKELQFEKITKIPFKFRLGSVQQCDWMEGKPNATNLF